MIPRSGICAFTWYLYLLIQSTSEISMDWYASFNRASITHTDLVRLIVILSLTISCIVITAVSLRAHIGTIYAQLFYFPILYATYFYPRRGLILSGICAVVYEVLA